MAVQTFKFELKPEELLGAAATFGVGGSCLLPAGRVRRHPCPLGYPNERIVPERKKNRPYTKHKSLRLFFLVMRRPNS